MRTDGRSDERRNGAARRLPLRVATTVFALALGIAISGSGVAACTGEASFMLPSLDAGAPSGRYGTVCNAWATRECAYTDACQVSVFAQWESDAQCIARETLVCELQGDDPDVPFDPALVDACTLPADCSAPIGIVSAESASALCLPPGKAPNGAPCVWGSGCQSRVCIYDSTTNGTAACGTCEPPIRCDCSANQRCVLTGDVVSCIDLPDAGDTCGAPLYACNDAKCVAASDGGATCQVVPEGGVGAPCSTDPTGPDCFFSGEAPLYCDHTDRCSAYVAATYGQPCTGEGSVCVGDGWCDSENTGDCQPPAPDGEPCNDDVPPCLPPSRCLAGACIFPTLATCSL
jgi:hypothetical protein